MGLFFTVSSRVFAVIAPSLVGDSITQIENFITESDLELEQIKKILIKNILLIIGAAITSGFFTFFMRQTIINVSRNIEFDLKNSIYNHYQKLSVNFYKKNRTGDLMSRISEDVSKVRMYVGPALMYSINTLTLFIIVISYMFSVSPRLSVYTLIPLPFLSFIIYKLSRAIHDKSSEVQKILAGLSTFAQETFSGIGIIKSFSVIKNRIKKMEIISRESKDKNMSLVSVQAWFFPMMILLIGASNILVIFIGGKQFINNEIELGVLAEFIIYVNMLTWPVATVGWITSIIQQAEASQKRINEFLDENPQISDFGKKELLSSEFPIEFKNVSLTYNDTGLKALNNLSFKIKNGETLALMGYTGSGKTSVIDVLTKTYLPTKGEVLIGNQSIKKISQKSLRNIMGIVPQEPFLFSDSIENNIKFGKNNANKKEIISSCKSAKIHKDILNFKNGYKTVLGERGITISGGQKQRVSIARALIKNPKILILDDCLSSVDTKTEEAILSELKKLKTGISTVIICHRISTAKNADKILVLNKGKLEQIGTHKELICVDGFYKKTFELEQANLN